MTIPRWIEARAMAEYAEDYPGFKDTIDGLYAIADELPAAAYDFVTDLHEKFERYGDETFVSDKQWQWLSNLAEKYL